MANVTRYVVLTEEEFKRLPRASAHNPWAAARLAAERDPGLEGQALRLFPVARVREVDLRPIPR